ncbi:MAG TPA: aminopeptidase P family protein [Candidatus Deferrimicrobiaceae bacterium]|nr:aminopeptidase P family protein [Candidatus Deferrimicrobiaceae bacterium]
MPRSNFQGTVFDSRIRRLLGILARRKVSLFLCVRMTNIRYLTGFSGSDAALLVSPEGVTFVTDGRYTEQARQEVRGAEIVVSDRKWSVVSRRIRAAIRRSGPGRTSRIGFESRHLSVEIYRFLGGRKDGKWMAMGDPVETLRMRKEEAEIRAVEEAAVVASGALLEVLAAGVRGRAEREVAADLERGMKILGAEEPSFRAIVASGARSALPHAEPTGSLIGRDEAVIIDFGARRRGYCSDETVSVLPARPSRSLRRVFDAVKRAQERGIRAIRPGVPCREVDSRVRESLDRSGYLKYFVHSSGHGVGLDIHERPSLSPRSKDRLAEGMIVTVEPGVYLPGVGGIRIEDMIRVTGRRGERVTYLPKQSPLLH